MNESDEIFDHNLQELLAGQDNFEVPPVIKARIRRRLFNRRRLSLLPLVTVSAAAAFAACLFLGGFYLGLSQTPEPIVRTVFISEHKPEAAVVVPKEQPTPYLQVAKSLTPEELLAYRQAVAQGYYEAGYYREAIEAYKRLYNEFPDKREGVEAIRRMGDIYLSELVEPGKASSLYRLYLDTAKAGGYQVVNGSATWLLDYMKAGISG